MASRTPPRGVTLPGRLFDRLQTSPDSPALAFYRPGRGPTEWKAYADVHAEAAATAAAMADLGCRPGTACIIVLPSGPAAARLVLAALLQGALPLLIAPPSILGSGSDLARVLDSTVRRSKARLVVCPQTMADEIDPSRWRSTRVVFGEETLTALPPGEATAPAPSGPGDLAALQLTSGTTGLPKICMWSHRGVLAAIDGMTAAMAVDQDDIFFNWTPLYHDMGLVNNYLTCLLAGIPLVMMSPHDFVKSPVSWLRGLTETRANVTWSPNFGFALATQRIREEELEAVELSHVSGFWNAAERIHLSTMIDFQQRFSPWGLAPDALKTNFGCAENVGGATFTETGKPFSYEYVDRDALLVERLAIPSTAESPTAVAVVGAGRAHPLMEISIRSRQGQPLPDGHIGEIALDTPSRMLGYWGDARASQRALSHGVLRTGDLGYLREGELFWVGRVKERITVRGRKLDPSDFEPVLFSVDGLRKGSFAAFGVDDEATGTQRVVVVSEVVEPLPVPPFRLRESIARAVLEKLGLSVEVLLVPPGTLTKTSSGKRRHRHFRREYERGRLQTIQIESP
ncbi:MAG TPA: AMP-binding protein [Acidimicrobiia bacterium]|nr:AMP-binding protein [Acidimicrobiia bacterium]